ncbi:MAG: ComEC/Rec2 family competence protein [Patescibacteria group bacterium]
MTPSKALFWFCVSFIVGIALQSSIKIPQIFLWGFLILGTSFVFLQLVIRVDSSKSLVNNALLIDFVKILKRKFDRTRRFIQVYKPTSYNKFAARILAKDANMALFTKLSNALFVISEHSLVIGFCLLFLIFGISRLQISEFNVENDKIRVLNDKEEKVVLLGQVVEEPDIRENYQKLKVHPVKYAIGVVGPEAEQFNWVKVDNSTILITTRNYPEYRYLDELKITGQLKTPFELESFNYKNYLLKDGIYSVVDFPKIELVSSKHHYNTFSFLYEKILFIKSKLISSIRTNFSFPGNTILEGVIFGNDKQMPRDLKNKFNATGLSHLTAVSGGNIVIITSILTFFLLFFGLWRTQALYLSLVFLCFYIALVGFPASGVRAAIMASILLFSQILGRQNTSSRTITLAGALMLLQNPMILRYDVGFQLSFLASMGIIHLKPIFDGFFAFLPKNLGAKTTKSDKIFFINTVKLRKLSIKILNFLLSIIFVTISAQIFTLPVIIYSFGTLSLVSLATNLLILPIIPPLMVFGVLASILGVFSGFLGWIFSLPCYALIFYFLRVLDIFSQPWTTKNLKVSLVLVLIYYLVLTILIFYLNKKLKPKFLGY